MSLDELRVGALLKGYCGGAFGDSYEDKRVEAVGFDWVVAREVDSGRVVFYDETPESLLKLLEVASESEVD